MPVLDSTLAAIGVGSRGWSVGYFSPGFDFANATTATIQANFVIFGTTSNVFATNGLFNAGIVATLPAYDATYTGKTIYTVVGDAPTVGASTCFVIFTANVVFPVVDALGNGFAHSTTATAANVVYGALATPAILPLQVSYPQGVEMLAAAVPEASGMLLGAIGSFALLRRRR